MFGMMKGNRVNVVSNHAYDLRTAVDSSFRKSYTDINGMACKDTNEATVMLWNYHDDDVKGEAEQITLQLKGIPAKKAQLYYYVIDDESSNSYEAWKKMGSPQSPSAEQIQQLERAGQLQMRGSPQWVTVRNGEYKLETEIKRQAVVLLKLSW
jgi:xylan 1,4-beta-xylosidase